MSKVIADEVKWDTTDWTSLEYRKGGFSCVCRALHVYVQVYTALYYIQWILVHVYGVFIAVLN
jgi:hypothetical protein